MNEVLLFALLTLGLLGTVAAVILYFVAQKFKVIEDPKIDLVDDVLPKANCGGCGFPGCRAFAEALVKSADVNKSIDGLNCPVGGNDVMKDAAAILGLEVQEQDPLIAVIRCNGSKANSPAKIDYDGPSTCAFAHNLYAGEGGCPHGCLGLGDCVASCDFDAIHMNPETGLPEVNDKCVACGACVKACPRGIIELRPKGKKDRRIFVSCINEEKGGVAKKNCAVACIGCSKCFKVCPFEAITMNNNLAYIDPIKCKLCRKCVEVCPTDAIHELNFPPRKKKPEVVENTTEKESVPAASSDNKNETQA
ncbi:MAG: Fe-S cluster domain-containing protein [Bacteroidetes bacterium]|nr:Fe-S cluster domain-containing protein [Bacteroidota bacterium]MBU1579730.1 Fe-S cluster domain-containing protein [Bacteroidota bacterium]MBU2556398.1 Fe-S cluster domain-containing protein [Bacteroidota bacterium]MDA3943974.1 Fe-S cluster domain-containing protein [Bacteroidota bacterium]